MNIYNSSPIKKKTNPTIKRIHLISFKNFTLILLIVLTLLISPLVLGIINSQQNVFQVTADSDKLLLAQSANQYSFNVGNKNYFPPNFSPSIELVDKRVFLLDEYFRVNNSPLYGYGKVFVDKCDQYGAPHNCLVVAAIAKNESDLCKYANSADMHNCWGFGGPGIYRTNFGSFEESIDRVTQVLVQQYGVKYMINPSLMERTFCGSEEGCTGWGGKIKSIMYSINDFGIGLGLGSTLDM